MPDDITPTREAFRQIDGFESLDGLAQLRAAEPTHVFGHVADALFAGLAASIGADVDALREAIEADDWLVAALGCKVADLVKAVQRGPDREAGLPSLHDVEHYCQWRGSLVDPRTFFEYYQANGWTIGRAPMRDWRAAFRYWERNANRNAKPTLKQQFSSSVAEFLSKEAP